MLVFLLMAGAEAPPGSAQSAMVEQVRALSLEATQKDGVVEVILRGQAPRPVDLRYSVELTGKSTSRNAGATRIDSSVPIVLSRMRMSVNGEWCARAHVKQGDGLEYTIQKGKCG